jgi:hypothetical protein
MLAIDRAIRESSFFIALLSKNSVSKVGYVQKELKIAMDILDQHPASGIFVVPVRLDPCKPEEERLRHLHWADLFMDYEACLSRLLKVFGSTPHSPQRQGESTELSGDALDELSPPKTRTGKPKPEKYNLRNQPRNVPEDEFERVFGLDYRGRPLEYIPNEYEDNGDGTVTDHATGLMWQQSGAKEYLTYENAKKYIDELNRNRFAGHDGWRLPTIDELTSLLEPEKKDNDFYIDPIFDNSQRWCWSADTVKGSSGLAWDVDFGVGVVSDVRDLYDDCHVRAVRA